MKNLKFQVRRNYFAPMTASLLFAGLLHAQAQPTLVSSIPASGATGVSPSAPVVFTFSEPMDTSVTEAMFVDITDPTTNLTTAASWSSDGTILTNTPVPPFPASNQIYWVVNGQNIGGTQLGGFPFGFFTTGSGGGSSSGSGTNRITSFTLGMFWAYDQSSSSAPTLDPVAPYAFMATTVLASNRTASAVTLTLPSMAVSNLMQNILHSEDFSLFFYTTGLTTLDSTFGVGDYRFNVQSTSNQTVQVNFPSTLVQPNAPHVTNYTACQSVNATQLFTIGWDTFQNGTAADYIYLSIGNVFHTPDLLAAGALNGTSRSVSIPAGTLQPSTSYDAMLSFYRVIFNTNDPTYATTVYRATTTQFNLTTAGGSVTPLVLTNMSLTSTNCKFVLSCPTNQTVTVESSITMQAGQWQSLLTTNSATGRVEVADPRAATNRYIFYRARTGP